MPDAFLDADAIRAACRIPCVEVHNSIGSTNDRAAELARDAACKFPALVVAREQTAGRGRGTHAWWSGNGALAFSLLLEPSRLGIVDAEWPRLSLASAVALCDAMKPLICATPNGAVAVAPAPVSWPNLGIKWPNDVFLAGRKVSGILLESPSQAAGKLIIGVGINVNNSWSDAPSAIQATGTSLRDFTGQCYELQAVLAAVIPAMFARFMQIRVDADKLANDWQELNFLTGQNVVITAADRRIEGTCLALATDGAIVISTSHGIQRCYSGSLALA